MGALLMARQFICPAVFVYAPRDVASEPVVPVFVQDMLVSVALLLIDVRALRVCAPIASILQARLPVSLQVPLIDRPHVR